MDAETPDTPQPSPEPAREAVANERTEGEARDESRRNGEGRRNGDGRGGIAVRYGAMGLVGEFTPRKNLELRCRAKVVVQTDRGIELGEPVGFACATCERDLDRQKVKEYVDRSGPDFYRFRAGRVLREATAEDVHEHQRLNANIIPELQECRTLAREQGLQMRVITCEHLLGGERIVFYFRSEQRIDFRQLVKELAHRFQTRIEMRQVSEPDEARLVADYEVCGRECCCKNFLKKRRPVGMKMAKLQKSTLDPTKVSGRCSRLRCCLRYEHEGYEELAAKLPKRNARVDTPQGLGSVVDRQILTQLVAVRLDSGGDIVIPLDEIEVLTREEAARRAEQAAEKAAARPPRRERPPRPERETPAKPSAPAEPDAADATKETGDASEAEQKKTRRRRGSRGRRSKQRTESGPDAPTDATQRSASNDANRPPDKSATPQTPASPAGADDAQPSDDAQRSSKRRRRRRRKPRDGDGHAGPPASPQS